MPLQVGAVRGRRVRLAQSRPTSTVDVVTGWLPRQCTAAKLSGSVSQGVCSSRSPKSDANRGGVHQRNAFAERPQVGQRFGTYQRDVAGKHHCCVDLLWYAGEDCDKSRGFLLLIPILIQKFPCFYFRIFCICMSFIRISTPIDIYLL